WPPRLGGASVQARRLALFDRARDRPRGAWAPKARALRDERGFERMRYDEYRAKGVTLAAAA
ncbi:MAG TPA: hypothetical protein DDZ84_12165, partial [Firmicutes bacterium]|nr:hypothetical protein [Bacillota bacterium]